MKLEKIRQIIIRHNLKPTSQRELPLFTLSCTFLGYTKLLRNILGYSYETVGAIGGEGRFHSLFNETHIVAATEKLVENNYESLDRIAFIPARKIFKECALRLSELKIKKSDPIIGLGMIVGFYPSYMACIGIYNCFWRYLGNNYSKGNLSLADSKRIARERNRVAKFYPKVEKLIKVYTALIGKTQGFDGDILRYFTYSEMNQYVKGNLHLKKIIPVLSLRRKKYFYLYIEQEDKEEIITDKNIIKKVYKEFYQTKDNVKEVKGFSVYKGVVRGTVYKSGLPVSGKYVLVTSMTHPADFVLIKKAAAIVTDEGGVLCHAAIVARELKKPCIIGTKIATRVLRDGDRVEVDAGKGLIKRIV